MEQEHALKSPYQSPFWDVGTYKKKPAYGLARACNVNI